MTKYRLKDQDRQEHLEKSLPGFNASLQDAMRHRYRWSDTIDVSDDYDRWSITFPVDEIVSEGEYIPDGWNDYPAITPPEGVLMRVECKNGIKTSAQCHNGSDGARWCYQNGAAWPKFLSDNVRRFRLWE